MFVKYTFTSTTPDGERKITIQESQHPCETERQLILEGILLEWQCSAKTRQAIAASQAIPVQYTSFNGLQNIHYELERQDICDLFELFKRPENRRAGVQEGEEEGRCLEELKVVYKLLKKEAN